MRDLLLRIGNYSQIISVNGNTTIFVGNTRGKEPYQKTHSNLAEALFSFMKASHLSLSDSPSTSEPIL